MSFSETPQFRITYIVKPDPESRYEHIMDVGNSDEHWELSREVVINLIKTNLAYFYVQDSFSSEKANVEVCPPEPPQIVHEYIKTNPDRNIKNNLISLPQRPSTFLNRISSQHPIWACVRRLEQT